jgi:hypothetical protein
MKITFGGTEYMTKYMSKQREVIKGSKCNVKGIFWA